MASWNWGWCPILEDCYSEEFPMEIRGQIAEFLSSDLRFLEWNTQNPSVEEIQKITEFVSAVKCELNKLLQSLSSEGRGNFYYKEHVIRPMCQKIQGNSDTIKLFQAIRNSLKEEKRLLGEAIESDVVAMEFLPKPFEGISGNFPSFQTLVEMIGKNEITWDLLIYCIDQEFVKLGRSLNNKQMKFLQDKLFSGSETKGNLVNMDLFLRKRFPIMSNATTDIQGVTGLKISFAEWLFHCLEVLKLDPSPVERNLQKMWAEGKILGFVTKKGLEKRLRTCKPGTFAIYFPERFPSHIALCFYNFQATGSEDKLQKWIFSLEDLGRQSLARRILGKDEFTHLYSNYKVEDFGHVVEKKRAFSLRVLVGSTIFFE